MPASYWSEEEFLRPAFIDDAVWQKILSNFLGTVSDPVADVGAVLADDLSRLSDMGLSSPSDLAGLLFAFEQAGAMGAGCF